MPRKTPIPNEQEITQLHRWAIIAFAARCARRVQPLFQAAWPEAPPEHIKTIDAAISIAEDTADTAAAAACAANIAADAFNTAAQAPTYLADAAAKAAAYAAYATGAHSADAAQAAAQTAAAAADTLTIDITLYLRQDFERLLRAIKKEKWTANTPVSPDFFGALWPTGPPDWRQALTQPNDQKTDQTHQPPDKP